MTARIMPERRFYGNVGASPITGLITDYSGSTRALAPGERRLGAFILPPFQRGLVWTDTQKVRLIESIYLGLPIGALVYNQTSMEGPCDRWLLDGQQRLSAIGAFLDGRLAVNGWRYPELPEIERRHFSRIAVGTIQTQIESEEECREIYDRLVYGGTAHEPKESENA